MTRQTIEMALAAVIFAGLFSANRAEAQTPVLGAQVESRTYYNGYGIPDYPDGPPPGEKYSGFGHAYGVFSFSYSGYGNGPYGSGGGSEHEFLSTNRFGNGASRYDGYGTAGYVGWGHPQRYNPYGLRAPKWARFD